MSQTQTVTSLLKSKRQLTPKVNHTKTTITKSSPFLISRHHLDDTEMKKALRYEERSMTQRLPRTYSYKGEIVTCQNSKYISQIAPQPSNLPLSGKPQQTQATDYYAIKNEYPPSSKNRDAAPANDSYQEAPYFKGSVRQKRANTQRQQVERANRKQAISSKDIEKLTQRMVQNEEYGLKQMDSARKKMEKEAKKLRNLFKRKVERDIEETENQQMLKLEQQVRQLKIKALELEKEKLAEDLKHTTKKKETTEQDVLERQIHQNFRYTLSQLILNKPKYKPKPSLAEDTDSSFSSLQFD